MYEIQETVAGGRLIYQKQNEDEREGLFSIAIVALLPKSTTNTDTCISWHARYSNWWIGSCDTIGTDTGYAWLKENQRCPTGPGQTWWTHLYEPIYEAIATDLDRWAVGG